MFRIGLTGGIGSGKTTVASIFEVLGIPVYYADDAAKRLMNENPELVSGIKKLFGDNSYTEGKLNRAFISAEVFSNPEILARLNALVHPITISDAKKWMKKQITPYAIKEAAIIFESNSHVHLDYIIGVSSPIEMRIQRVMQRDNVSREQVYSRIQQQMDENEKMSRCDFVVYNDERQLIIPQVLKIHEELLKNCK
ncbi:MAG: dephospho-CoA kinase [Ferruginibacter sp.]|nr:dephospho-CoA kinase [Ferruginibacter sp.]